MPRVGQAFFMGVMECGAFGYSRRQLFANAAIAPRASPRSRGLIAHVRWARSLGKPLKSGCQTWPLVLVSGLLLWQAVERIFHPATVVGSVAIIVGLAAAAANWGVARLLLAPSRDNAAIRLAYIHNIGDVYVSLAPVVAGFLIILTGYSIFDPLIAGGIALWIIVSTAREVFGSSEELIWPEKIVCGHSNEQQTTP